MLSLREFRSFANGHWRTKSFVDDQWGSQHTTWLIEIYGDSLVDHHRFDLRRDENTEWLLKEAPTINRYNVDVFSFTASDTWSIRSIASFIFYFISGFPVVPTYLTVAPILSSQHRNHRCGSLRATPSQCISTFSRRCCYARSHCMCASLIWCSFGLGSCYRLCSDRDVSLFFFAPFYHLHIAPLKYSRLRINANLPYVVTQPHHKRLLTSMHLRRAVVSMQLSIRLTMFSNISTSVQLLVVSRLPNRKGINKN